MIQLTIHKICLICFNILLFFRSIFFKNFNTCIRKMLMFLFRGPISSLISDSSSSEKRLLSINYYRRVIWIKLLCKCFEITLWHYCSPVNLLYIFRTSFLRKSLEGCFWQYRISMLGVLGPTPSNCYEIF